MPAELRSLCRQYTEVNVQTLAGFATSPQVEDDIKLRAIIYLLDRGWGKPKQQVEHTGEDGTPLEIIVRTIIEERKK